VELCIEDDNASVGSDDSFAVLPDLRSCKRDANGPDPRASRAHSALRQNHRGGIANKIPFDISHVDLSFPSSNKDSSHKISGKRLVSCNLPN